MTYDTINPTFVAFHKSQIIQPCNVPNKNYKYVQYETHELISPPQN